MNGKKKRYLLGIDFGGGGSKATLIDESGAIIAESTAEYPTLHPESGACEQDPDDWLAALRSNTHAILDRSGIAADEIAAVAVDSATHTFLLTDGDMRPIFNAVHWTDSRSIEEARMLRAEHGEEIFGKTYHYPDTIWTLPQLLWMKKNHPDIFERARYIFFEKDYIRYCLTGVYATDCIEAAGSMLFDSSRGVWDEGLTAMASLTPDMLPPIKRPTDKAGEITEAAARETGLAAGTPVICGTTDTVLEVLASGAIKPGDTTVKLATAGRICVITDRPHPDRQLVCYPHIEDGLWYPGSATKAAASSLRWYRDTFGGSYGELDSAAEAIPAGCEGLLYHPYINGELTPYADPLLAGSFVGIRSTHTKAHFTRAVLEGVAFSLLEGVNYLRGMGIELGSRATLIGGGARSRLWSRISADVLGIELTVTESSDSSLGAAMLAGIALGIFKDAADAVKRCIKEVYSVTPDREMHEEYMKIFKKYKKVQAALAPLYHENT